MGKVLIALSNANLLDPEMMFSEGEPPLLFFSQIHSGRTDERRKEKYVPNPPARFPWGGI